MSPRHDNILDGRENVRSLDSITMTSLCSIQSECLAWLGQPTGSDTSHNGTRFSLQRSSLPPPPPWPRPPHKRAPFNANQLNWNDCILPGQIIVMVLLPRPQLLVLLFIFNIFFFAGLLACLVHYY